MYCQDLWIHPSLVFHSFTHRLPICPLWSILISFLLTKLKWKPNQGIFYLKWRFFLSWQIISNSIKPTARKPSFWVLFWTCWFLWKCKIIMFLGMLFFSAFFIHTPWFFCFVSDCSPLCPVCLRFLWSVSPWNVESKSLNTITENTLFIQILIHLKYLGKMFYVLHCLLFLSPYLWKRRLSHYTIQSCEELITRDDSIACRTSSQKVTNKQVYKQKLDKGLRHLIMKLRSTKEQIIKPLLENESTKHESFLRSSV